MFGYWSEAMKFNHPSTKSVHRDPCHLPLRVPYEGPVEANDAAGRQIDRHHLSGKHTS